MNIKAIIIDDEPKAIDNLQILLSEYCKEIEVVATAENVDNALKLIKLHKPSVIFLDIEMPIKSGFTLLEETNEQFQTIFVTAYNQYAVKAFEVSAVDYLLKPIAIERLKQAVAKIKLNNNLEIDQQKVQVLDKNLQNQALQQISLPYRDRLKILEIENIICIEANQAYSTIYYIENKRIQEHVYSKSLSYFEKLLHENTNFYRTHRSWMVNTNYVKEIYRNNYTIKLEYDISVNISRNRMKSFSELF